jgi:hypothetical protein
VTGIANLCLYLKCKVRRKSLETAFPLRGKSSGPCIKDCPKTNRLGSAVGPLAASRVDADHPAELPDSFSPYRSRESLAEAANANSVKAKHASSRRSVAWCNGKSPRPFHPFHQTAWPSSLEGALARLRYLISLISRSGAVAPSSAGRLETGASAVPPVLYSTCGKSSM